MKAKYLLTEKEFARGKRIKMPKARLARWLEALRDPRNKQGRGTLFEPHTKGFCCLGLEQAANNAGCVEGQDRFGFRSLPSLDYLQENGIHFAKTNLLQKTDPQLEFRNGYQQSASSANDSGKKFTTIAEAIERVAVGY